MHTNSLNSKFEIEINKIIKLEINKKYQKINKYKIV